jgi:hypothetical protein
MSLNKRSVAQYKPERDIEVKWDNFSGGWNSIFKPTELKDTELAQADNAMLIGKGTPTGRWGSEIYNLAGESGKIRLLDGYYNSLTSTNYLLSITDQGFFTKKSGASYAIITGASFASGQSYFFSQLGNYGYINGPSTNYVRFDGTNLLPYIGLSAPTNVSLAQLSQASGFQAYSWLITATSATGETLPSVFRSLASLPLDLTETSIRVSWNQVSLANASTTGYNIYRGFPGDETYIASVGQSATPQYVDTGTAQSNTVFPPTSDTTTGPRARFRLKFDDRIVLAGLDGEPSKVLISGRYPYHDRFTAIDGGGYVLVSPNDGDDITGLGIAGNQGMVTGGSALPRSGILVFKNNSVHRVVLDTVTLGNFSILDPQAQLLTGSNGCSSADTIQAVENDTFYFGRKGLYTVGQEPQYLNQIRTNELTARVRSYVQNLSDADFKMACAGYMDNKYLLSFPSLKETIQYDRERGAFMGPWKTPWGITKWYKYQDEGGNEKWLAGSDTGPYIREFSSSYISDSGTAVAKTLRSRKEDMGDWSIFKVLKLFYVLFRNVRGDVTINLRIEDRSGNTVTTKSFNVTSQLGSGGWGADQWGSQPYGQTDATVTLTGDELVRYANIYKNCRVVQVEVISTGANTNFEWLGVRMTAQGLGDQSLPASVKV